MFIQLPTTSDSSVTINVTKITSIRAYRDAKDGTSLKTVVIMESIHNFHMINLPYQEVHDRVAQVAEQWAAMLAGGGASKAL